MKNKSFLVIALISVSLFSFTFASLSGKIPKSVRKEFSFVDTHEFRLGEQTQKVNGYFMKTTEVSNGEYLEFIKDLEQKGDKEALKIALPDTAAWRTNNAYNEPFVQYYFRHEAYRNYPVVNVSYEGAQAYCVWRTQKGLTEKNKEGAVMNFRLPTKNEWLSGAFNSTNAVNYAWGGNDIRNHKGCPLCNYRQVPGENGTDASIPVSAEDNADVTAPVNSYSPNNWGFYNMNGNVAEMIDEKGIAMGGSWKSTKEEVTNTSEMKYEKPGPTIGFRVVMTYFYKKTE